MPKPRPLSSRQAGVLPLPQTRRSPAAVLGGDGDTTACYVDVEGLYYTRDGTVIDKPEGVEALLSDNVMPLRCPHAPTACRMATLIRDVKSCKDSIGGTLMGVCTNVPAGLGEPCFDKLEAKLAHAMLSLPATKAVPPPRPTPCHTMWPIPINTSVRPPNPIPQPVPPAPRDLRSGVASEGLG